MVMELGFCMRIYEVVSMQIRKRVVEAEVLGSPEHVLEHINSGKALGNSVTPSWQNGGLQIRTRTEFCLTNIVFKINLKEILTFKIWEITDKNLLFLAAHKESEDVDYPRSSGNNMSIR